MFVFQTLLPIFIETVFPVFLVACSGFLLARVFTIDTRSIGRLMFYLATPALVFRSLYQMNVDLTMLRNMAVIAATVVIFSGVAGWLIGTNQERKRRAAIALTSAVSNNGNMGISISYFAFGDTGLALGSIYYVVGSFLSNTLGVAVASAGRAPIAVALANSLRVPVLYAAILGLVLNRTGGAIPTPVFRAVDLLANAAIPGMLILLGIQLHAAPLSGGQAVIARSAAIRLLAAPVLAWLLCHWLNVTGIERNVLVLQSAMPTAVMAAVLATEYDTAPELVAAGILFTTLVSLITLSVVLWLLM